MPDDSPYICMLPPGVASQNRCFGIRIKGNHLCREPYEVSLAGAGEEEGKQQEIPAGDRQIGSGGEIEHKTEKCAIPPRRSRCPESLLSSLDPAALAAVATSSRSSSRRRCLQFVLQ
jgi:hypothetical protein